LFANQVKPNQQKKDPNTDKHILTMKATTLVASTMFAVTSAFAPASRMAFNSAVGARAFSRSAAALMANPK